jgi:hypothetical protein
MARPSKLTDAQWEELKARLAKGEKAADLSREYGISKTAISVRVSKRAETVKNVAHQLVAADEALRSLPLPEQLAAVSLADELRAISTHLASAGKFGAATAHRLAGIVHAQVQLVDDAEPEKSIQTLHRVAALTKMANESSVIGLNLLNANKDLAKLAHDDAPIAPVKVVINVQDASEPESNAQ